MCCRLHSPQHTLHNSSDAAGPTAALAAVALAAASPAQPAATQLPVAEPTPTSPSPPSPSPAPQKRRVECGRPGRCSEAAGLKDPNDGHEVRCCSDVHSPFRIRLRGTPTPGPETRVALFGVGQMRALSGSARRTRPLRRLRPPAERQAPGCAPPRSSWTAVRRARAVGSIRNWSGPSRRRRRRRRRRHYRYHSSGPL